MLKTCSFGSTFNLLLSLEKGTKLFVHHKIGFYFNKHCLRMIWQDLKKKKTDEKRKKIYQEPYLSLINLNICFKWTTFFKSLLNFLQFCFCFLFCVFGPESCGILALPPGSNLHPWLWVFWEWKFRASGTVSLQDVVSSLTPCLALLRAFFSLRELQTFHLSLKHSVEMLWNNLLNWQRL